MEFKYDVFISYSRRDYIDENNNIIPDNPISKLKEYLSDSGISYWFDKEGIIHGDQFARVIVKNIKASRILLFVSSEHSNLSEWTCKEIATAEKYKRKIIPFRIDKSDFNDAIMLYLADLDFIDYCNNPTSSLKELVDSITQYKVEHSKRQQEDALLSEVTLLARNAQKAIQMQVSVLSEIFKKLKIIGVSNKKCPVCNTLISMEHKYCNCCGFHFPMFYGISDLDKDIDQTYLAIMKGLWMSVSPELKDVPLNTNEITTGGKPKVRKQKKEKGVFFVGDVKFKMIPVEGGAFTMGNEGSAHKVSVSSYKIGETPVTQELWNAVMGNNPSKYKGEKRPVEQVSWEDCQSFLKKLNQITGKTFRLPTEAEWEFAARGGNRTKKTSYSGSDNVDDVAWYNLNCSEKEEFGLHVGTHDVMAKIPNELFIYDMSGNVWEWCTDWFADYALHYEANPIGPTTGQGKVCRGGSWNNPADFCKVSNRNYGGIYKRDSSYGFRLAL